MTFPKGDIPSWFWILSTKKQTLTGFNLFERLFSYKYVDTLFSVNFVVPWGDFGLCILGRIFDSLWTFVFPLGSLVGPRPLEDLHSSCGLSYLVELRWVFGVS